MASRINRLDDRTRVDGTKARVLKLFTDYPGVRMSMADVSENLGMSKIDRPEVSSVLVKLVKQGKVIKIAGTTAPTEAVRGRRQVNLYELAQESNHVQQQTI